MWLSFTMNGILCAYFRDTEPEHAERRGHGVAAALDRQLHDVLGVEVGRVRRERRAGRVLDALIDRQDRHVAGAAQPAGVEQRLQAAQHARRAVRQREDAVDEVGTRQVQVDSRGSSCTGARAAPSRRRESIRSCPRPGARHVARRVTLSRRHDIILDRICVQSRSYHAAQLRGKVEVLDLRGAHRASRPVRRSAGAAPPASTSSSRARVAGLRGVNSVQQSWSGMIEIG